MKTSDTPSAPRVFRFGPYVVDGRRRLLWRDGALIPLTSKALAVLDLLLRNRSRVVAKDELLAQLWPDTQVGENTLTRHISTLRKALEERPAEHHYIVTIPGHGYQFVADAIEIDECPPELLHSVRASDGPDSNPHPPLDGTAAFTTSQPSDFPNVAAVTLPGDGRTARWRNLRRAMAAGVVALGIALAVMLFMRRLPQASGNRVLRQVTFNAGLQREPAWSPDGHSIAYASDQSGQSAIWVQRLGDPTPTRVTSSVHQETQPDWSPDGRWLVFRSERDGGGLYVVSSAGGAERRIVNFGYQPRWSPDGSLVMFSSSGHEGGVARIYVVVPAGGTPRPVRPDLLSGRDGFIVDWRPGTRDVSAWGRPDGKWTFLTASIDGGRPIASSIPDRIRKQVDDEGLALTRFRWSPSGRHLFFEGRQQQVQNLWRVAVDPATLGWISGPERITTGSSDDVDIGVSNDGSRIIFSASHARTRLWSYPFDSVAGVLTGVGQPVTSGAAGEQDASAPVDGNKLVYRTVRAGRQEVWERSIADGSERLLIASTGWTRSRPRWSPDGLRIAYSRSRTDGSGGGEPAVAILQAGGEEQLLTGPGDLRVIPTDWSPDGRWLLGGCKAGPDGTIGTCRMPASPSPAKPGVEVIASEADRNLFEQRFSPDQRWISFISVDAADAGVSTVHVMPSAGGPWIPVTEGRAYDDKPQWSADGNTLYFISNREGVFNVWGRHFDLASGTPVGAPFRVTAFTTRRQAICARLGPMQIAVTSSRLFLPITETSGEIWMLENVDK